jgi:hypothetical protein
MIQDTLGDRQMQQAPSLLLKTLTCFVLSVPSCVVCAACLSASPPLPWTGLRLLLLTGCSSWVR